MLKETLPADEYGEENDRRLVVDGYSAMGKVTVLSEKGKSSPMSMRLESEEIISCFIR